MEVSAMEKLNITDKPLSEPIYFKTKDSLKSGTLDELRNKLHEIFEEDIVNVEYVKEVMERFNSNPKEWKKYSKFDPHRYTRNLIDDGNGKFNLMLLCWNEGQGSSIHSHADSHCFLRVLEGNAREVLYDWPTEGQAMLPRQVSDYPTGSVQYINDSMGLHRIENTSHTDPLITLHLYSPPFSECDCFDVRSGKGRSCCVTFWSKYGKRTHWSKVEAAVLDHKVKQ